MTNNNFERRIKDKLDRFEIEPSENLLDSIFEKRAARSKGVLRFSYAKLGIALLAVAVLTVAIIYWPDSGVKTGSQVENSRANTAVTDSPLEELKLEENALANESLTPKSNKDVPGIESNRLAEKVRKQDIQSPQEKKRQRIAVRESKSDRLAGREKSVQTKLKGEYNDNGYNIEERYFNPDALNKPLVASVQHQGNSHMIVYHSVNQEKMDNLGLNFLLPKPVRRFPAGQNDKETLSGMDMNAYHPSVKRRKPIFIDVLLTPMISFHNVLGNSELELNYESIAQSSFNMQYSARVSVPVSRRINVFSGIGYMNLSTDFNGSHTTSENKTDYETVTEYINDPVHGTIVVSHIDTINYISSEESDYQFNNSYQMLTIPLGLSYNFGYKKFDFAIHGSALLNIYTHAAGSNADFSNSQTTEFTSSKKHAGIGCGIGFMAAYRLNNRYQLVMEPNFQYFMINSQKNGNVVNEKIINTGLSLGLRYTLF